MAPLRRRSIQLSAFIICESSFSIGIDALLFIGGCCTCALCDEDIKVFTDDSISYTEPMIIYGVQKND